MRNFWTVGGAQGNPSQPNNEQFVQCQFGVLVTSVLGFKARVDHLESIQDMCLKVSDLQARVSHTQWVCLGDRFLVFFSNFEIFFQVQNISSK